MKLPKTVLVAGKRIKVKVLDLEDFGSYHHDLGEIRINKDLLKDQIELWSTFRHELTHCALAMGGLSHSEHYEEESIIRCLDNLFWPVWNTLTS